MRKYLTLILLAPVAVACATPGTRTAVGAGGGAAVGAGVGAIAGGWKGAAIGAAVGGLAGGAVGNYLDKQAEELKQVAETTKRTKDGILVDLKSKLLFTTDSAVLKPEAVEMVAKLGDIFAKYPADRIRIAGYTDSTGSVAHNEQRLLHRRHVLAGEHDLELPGIDPLAPGPVHLIRADVAHRFSPGGEEALHPVELIVQRVPELARVGLVEEQDVSVEEALGLFHFL